MGTSQNSLQSDGKILGVDYGSSSIGLAVCDESRQFVFGRGVVKLTPKHGLKPVLNKIKEIVDSEHISQILIGLPFSGEGSETAQTSKIRQFGQHVQTFLPDLQIIFGDESFSSFEADNLLADSNLDFTTKKTMQHELAAGIIIKKYLKIS